MPHPVQLCTKQSNQYNTHQCKPVPVQTSTTQTNQCNTNQCKTVQKPTSATQYKTRQSRAVQHYNQNSAKETAANPLKVNSKMQLLLSGQTLQRWTPKDERRATTYFYNKKNTKIVLQQLKIYDKTGRVGLGGPRLILKNIFLHLSRWFQWVFSQIL